MRRALVLAGIAAAAASVQVAAPRSAARHAAVSVTPQRALLDAPFRVRVTGLRARERVTVVSTGRSVLGRTWRAALPARADGRGRIESARAPLMSAMRPLRASPAGDAFPPLVARVRVAVRAGGATRAATTSVRDAGAESVKVADERPAAVAFYGEYFTPRGRSSSVAVLFLGGSDGGLPSPYAPRVLAARGHPVLTLAYFGAPGLPAQLHRIPLEYFAGALRWLRRQPGVRKVAVLGVSRGAEAALLIGATYPDFVDGVAEYAGSARIEPSFPYDPAVAAWTSGGQPVPERPIAVERIRGPVFAVGGGNDELSASGAAARAIAARMRSAGRAGVTALVYARAGHAVAAVVPNVPTRSFLESAGRPLRLGGTPLADAAARADAWPRLLRFLDRL